MKIIYQYSRLAIVQKEVMGEAWFDLSSLKSGMYYVIVSNPWGQTNTFKLIKL
ncbi:MAG: T9SS type A sorting domain-containing protein [Flavobacteriales bacterium]|nr:T9SS type A sorting domain-containing protein [Flavobacteriales bacterium]